MTVSVNNSTISASESLAVANGIEVVTLTVTLRNSSNAGQAGLNVSLVIDPSLPGDSVAYVGDGFSTTNGSGVAVVQFSCLQFGIRTFTVAVGGTPILLSTTVEFTQNQYGTGYVSQDPFNSTGQKATNTVLSGKEIVVKAESNNSGAITEITWNGFQVLNALNKSRHLQPKWVLEDDTFVGTTQLNEAGALSEAWGDSSSSPFIGELTNVREYLSQTFTAFNAPFSYNGRTLSAAGNLLSKQLYMDFMGNPHIIALKTGLRQFSSTKNGSLTWALSLSATEIFTKVYSYAPDGGTAVATEVLVGQPSGQTFLTSTGGPIVANADGTVAIGIFRSPKAVGHTLNFVVVKPGAAEGGNPKFTTNYCQLIDYELAAENNGSSAGLQHAERYLCIGTLADVTDAFDTLREYSLTRINMGSSNAGGGYTPTVTGLAIQSAPTTVVINNDFDVSIAAIDTLGNTVTSYVGTATIEDLVNNSELTGVKSVAFVAGIATFQDLQFTRAGSRTLRVHSGSFSINAQLTALNPVPVLSTVSPNTLGDNVTTTTNLVLVGSNFVAGQSQVTFNGIPLPTTFINSAELRAVLPASLIAQGTYLVRVTTSGPGGGVSSAVAFTVSDATPPVISNFVVSVGPGNQYLDVTYFVNELSNTTVLVFAPTSSFEISLPLGQGHFQWQMPSPELGNYQIQIRATDTSNNTSLSAPAFVTVGDVTPPVILTNTVTNLGATSARIEWTTDEAVVGGVRYKVLGTSTLISVPSQTNPNAANSYFVQLPGLTPDTTYEYVITARNAVNLVTTAAGQFTTLELQDNIPPSITSGPTSDQITVSSVRVRWSTDEASTTVVRLGTSSGVYTITRTIPGYRATHEVPIGNLATGTSYFYRVEGQDAAGNSYASPEQVFSTLPTPVTEDLEAGEELAVVEFIHPASLAVGDTFYAHFPVPIVKQTDLNINWKLGTNVVQRHTVTRKANGDVNSVECIAPVTIPSGSVVGDPFTLTLVATSDAPGSTYSPSAIGTVNMTVTMPAGSGDPSLTANILASNNTTTYKEGPWCKSFSVYNRLTDGTLNTLGVHAFVTQYKDQNFAFVTLLINNAHVNPDNVPGTGFDNPFEVVGKIYFDEMTVDSSATSYNIAPRVLKYCMTQVDSNTLKLVAYGPSAGQTASPGYGISAKIVGRSFSGVQSEIFGAGMIRVEHLILYPGSPTLSLAKIQSLADFSYVGRVVSGRNDPKYVRWHGPGMFRSASLPADYVGTGPGVTAALQANPDRPVTGDYGYDLMRMGDQGNAIKHLLQNNTFPTADYTKAGMDFSLWTSAAFCGCWTPGFNADGTDDSIFGAHLYDLQPGPGHTKGWSYWYDQLVERHWIWMFDSTGRVLGAQDFQDTGSANTPFRRILTENLESRGVQPFFGYLPNKSIHTQLYSYNTGTCAYDTTTNKPFDVYTPVASSHYQRPFRCTFGLSNTINHPLYKLFLRAEAELFIHQSDYRTGNIPGPNYPNTAESVFGPNFGTLREVLVLYPLNQPTALNKGISPGNFEWDKSKAIPFIVMSAWYMFADPSATYQNGSTTLRAQTKALMDNYHDVLVRTMPGGLTSTFPVNARLINNKIANSAFLDDRKADIGCWIYRYDQLTNPFIVAPNGAVHIILESEAGGTISVYAELMFAIPETATSGTVGLSYPVDRLGTGVPNPFTDGALIKGLDTSNGLALSGRAVLRTPQGYPIRLGQANFFYEVGEATLHQHAWFCVASAVFDGVDTAKRNNLYRWVHDYVAARVDNPDYYSAIVEPEGLSGGYNLGGAVGTKVQSGQNYSPDSRIANRSNDTFGQVPSPPFGVQYNSTTENESVFSGLAHVGAAYAADALGIEALSTFSSALREGRKIWVAPTASEWSAKLQRVADVSARSYSGAVVDRWPILAPLFGEVLYQQQVNNVPEVEVQFPVLSIGAAEGSSGNLIINTFGGETTTQDIVVRVEIGGNGTAPSSAYVVDTGEYTIPVGQASVNIPITINNDNVYTGLRTLELILVVVDGPATVRDGYGTLIVNIIDDEVLLPVISFANAVPSMSENSTIQINLTSDIPLSSGIVIGVSLTGTAEEEVDYQINEWSGGIAGQISISPPSIPTGFIRLETLDVTENVTLTITLQPGTGYELGALSQISILIQDTTIAGDSELLVKGLRTTRLVNVVAGSPPQLIQAMVPFKNGVETAPAMYIQPIADNYGGLSSGDQLAIACDMFPIARNAVGDITLFHAVARVANPQRLESIPGASVNGVPLSRYKIGVGPGTVPSGLTFNMNSALLQVVLEIKLANVAQPFRCRPFWTGDITNPHIVTSNTQTGNFLRKREVTCRFVNPTVNGSLNIPGNRCLIVKIQATERTDFDVALLDVIIENSALDGDANPYAANPDSDGNVVFDYIKMYRANGITNAIPIETTSRKFREFTTRPYSTGAVTGTSDRQWWLIKPPTEYTNPGGVTAANQHHEFLPGDVTARRLAIYDDAVSTDYVDDILKRRDFAWVEGDLGYHNGGWGEYNWHMPKYSQVATNIDLIRIVDKGDTLYSNEINALNSNLEDQSTPVFGWARPRGPKGVGAAGEDGVTMIGAPIPGWGMIAAVMMRLDQTIDRLHNAQFNLRTRRPLMDIDIAFNNLAEYRAARPGEANALALDPNLPVLPYAFRADSFGTMMVTAWMSPSYAPLVDGGGGYHPNFQLALCDNSGLYPWNKPENGKGCYYTTLTSNGSGGAGTRTAGLFHWIMNNGEDWGPNWGTHCSREHGVMRAGIYLFGDWIAIKAAEINACTRGMAVRLQSPYYPGMNLGPNGRTRMGSPYFEAGSGILRWTGALQSMPFGGGTFGKARGGYFRPPQAPIQSTGAIVPNNAVGGPDTPRGTVNPIAVIALYAAVATNAYRQTIGVGQTGADAYGTVWFNAFDHIVSDLGTYSLLQTSGFSSPPVYTSSSRRLSPPETDPNCSLGTVEDISDYANREYNFPGGTENTSTDPAHQDDVWAVSAPGYHHLYGLTAHSGVYRSIIPPNNAAYEALFRRIASLPEVWGDAAEHQIATRWDGVRGVWFTARYATRIGTTAQMPLHPDNPNLSLQTVRTTGQNIWHERTLKRCAPGILSNHFGGMCAAALEVFQPGTPEFSNIIKAVKLNYSSSTDPLGATDQQMFNNVVSAFNSQWLQSFSPNNSEHLVALIGKLQYLGLGGESAPSGSSLRVTAGEFDENGYAVIEVVVDGAELSNAVTVPITISGTAVEDTDFEVTEWSGGTPGEVEIDPETQKGYIKVKYLPDTATATGTDTIIATIDPAFEDITIGTDEVTINVNRVIATTSSLLWKGLQGGMTAAVSGYTGPQIVQTVIPVEPPQAVLPEYTINGAKCEVYPVGKDANGKHNLVHVATLIDNPDRLISIPGQDVDGQPAHIITLSEVGDTVPAATILSVDMQDIELEIKLANVAQVYKCRPFDDGVGNKSKLQNSVRLIDGTIIRRTEGLARFVDPTHGTPLVTRGKACLIVKACITERSDLEIATIDVLIENSALKGSDDPRQPNTGSDFSVKFDYVKIYRTDAFNGTPRETTYKFTEIQTRDSTGAAPIGSSLAGDARAWWLVKPPVDVPGQGADEQNELLPGDYFGRRLALYEDTIAVGYANDAVARRDFAWVDGSLGYFRGGWGEYGFNMPHFKTLGGDFDFTDLISDSDTEETNARNYMSTSVVTDILYSATNKVFGWAKPYGSRNVGQASEDGIIIGGIITPGWGTIAANLLIADMTAERHRCAAFNLDTLRPLQDEDIADPTTKVMPYGFSSTTFNRRHKTAWMTLPDDPHNHSNFWLAQPSTAAPAHAWNSFDSGKSCFYTEVDGGGESQFNWQQISGGEWASFGPHQNTHCTKHITPNRACLFLVNDWLALKYAEIDASMRLMTIGRLPMNQGSPSAQRDDSALDEFHIYWMKTTRGNGIPPYRAIWDNRYHNGHGASTVRGFVNPIDSVVLYHMFAPTWFRDQINTWGDPYCFSDNIVSFFGHVINGAGMYSASDANDGAPSAYQQGGFPNPLTKTGALPGGIHNGHPQWWTHTHGLHLVYGVAAFSGVSRLMIDADDIRAKLLFKQMASLPDVWAKSASRFVQTTAWGTGAWWNGLYAIGSVGIQGRDNPRLTEGRAIAGGITWHAQTLSNIDRNPERYAFKVPFFVKQHRSWGDCLNGLKMNFGIHGQSDEDLFDAMRSHWTYFLTNPGQQPGPRHLMMAVLGLMQWTNRGV